MLNRRQFLHLVASGVAAETLLPFCDPSLQAELPLAPQDSEVHLKKRYIPQNKSYGSGNFGEWTTDANDLPCYRYLCNQTENPIAVTPVETAWRAPTDHTHQVGNDRLVAAVSNYGYVQVRQDEGGAKFLNDYHPESGYFGAGLGYLTDGQEVLGTYYPGAGQSFDRFFGMGYLRKQIEGVNFTVDQVIYAPFGDDPVLISEVTISSQNPAPANLYWAEYWGCQSYPFSYQALIEGREVTALGSELDPNKVVKLRRDAARRFDHRFERIPNRAALLETKELRSGPIQTIGAAIQEELASSLPLFQASSAASGAAAAQPGETIPPTTFLASLDDGPVRFLTNAASFFGSANTLRHTGPAGPGGVPVPDELLHPSGLLGLKPPNAGDSTAPPDDLSATGPESALILLKPFTLGAGQSQTLRFLYGYLAKGFSASELIAKYRQQAPTLFAESSAKWKNEGIEFAVAGDPKSGDESWVGREVTWHNYYLRSGLTYDDFFEEHIVSQGSIYQYCNGIQGAARDPLQHAMPFIFGESRLTKEVLRYTLKSQGEDGALPFALTGHGSAVTFPWTASDLDLWLLWLASEYILATRDTGFLDERLTTYPSHPGVAGAAVQTVREKLDRACRHLFETIGTGKHGLLRGLNDDWNDNIFEQGVPPGGGAEVLSESESVMNAAMAAYVLDHYARMLRYSGDAGAAKLASARAAAQRKAVQAQWAGRWFKRLWLGPTNGWVGGAEGPAARMWLDGQPWAMLGGCATPDQRKTLVQAIDELLRKPSRIGAKQVSRRVDWPGFVAGELGNGGVWAALDGPLIWALAGDDPAMAWDEWKKNSRAMHAEVYPGIWYGAWSGPDVFCSADSSHAGQTAYDWGLVDPEAADRPSILRGLSMTAWPVMNMHRHAWPLLSAAKLLGIEFTEAGLDLRATLPRPQYSFRSRLVGLEKSERGYLGWYAPQKAGSWAIRIKLPTDELPFKTLTINETSQAVPALEDGMLRFTGTSTPEKPLRWSLSAT